jgi:hypothetical protein
MRRGERRSGRAGEIAGKTLARFVEMRLRARISARSRIAREDVDGASIKATCRST